MRVWGFTYSKLQCGVCRMQTAFEPDTQHAHILPYPGKGAGGL